jgi:CheY-like chemotaxis protein
MIQGKPVTILLVEDDPAHAEIVRRSLSDSRIANRVVHVNDGQAAMDYLFHEGEYSDPVGHPIPSLILLDLRLPRVDGMEVLHRIKNDETLRHIPTVVLTTSAAEADMVRAYDGGAGSYLIKPMNLAKLMKLMEVFGFYWLIWNRDPV